MSFFKEKSNQDLFHLLLGIFLGTLVALYFPNLMASFSWVGKIFMNTLMSLVIPLVFLALVTAVTSIGNISKLGKTGKFLFFVILLNVVVASLIGLVIALLFQPGLSVNSEFFLGHTQNKLFASAQTVHFTDFVYSMFPANLGAVAVKSEILPIVIFGIFFSTAALKCVHFKEVQQALKICNGFKIIIMRMIHVLLKLTPIAIFSLIGDTIASSILQGHFLHDMLSVFKYLILFFLGCFVLSILQFIFIRIFIGKNVYKFLKCSLKSVITGFATSSSMATLPVIFESAKEDNIDDELAKFALPIVVVFNLGSSALYVSLSTLFVVQVLHVGLTYFDIFMIYIATVITGLGTTGIPNAGFIATITVLKMLAIPSSAVAILFPIDSILSRVRTGVNVWGHLVCVKFIDHLQKNKR